MTRTRLGASAVITIAVLLAAGCGGDEGSASTKWAGDLCTAITTWKTSIADTRQKLAGNLTEQGLKDAADEVKAANQALIDTVQGLGSPRTESGDQAKAAIDSLETTVESNADTIEKAVQGVSGISGVLDAASTVSASISAITAALSSTITDMQGLQETDDELRESFDAADSCEGVIPPGS